MPAPCRASAAAVLLTYSSRCWIQAACFPLHQIRPHRCTAAQRPPDKNKRGNVRATDSLLFPPPQNQQQGASGHQIAKEQCSIALNKGGLSSAAPESSAPAGL